jgi:probable HAF family extracellular repeat protein
MEVRRMSRMALRIFWGSAAMAAALVAVAATGASAPSPKASWTATDLGAHSPVGINGRGQVALSGGLQSGLHGVYLWKAGRLTYVGPGDPTAINEAGGIVGEKQLSNGASHAFLWENGQAIDLGTLPGRRNSGATALNERGQVVGWSGNTEASSHAFLWQNGHMTDLGVLPGGKWSTAIDVNERGQVVGSSDTRVKQAHTAVTTARPGHGFIWQDGRMTDLGTVGSGDRNSTAVGIGYDGTVLAYSWHTVPDPDDERYDAAYPHGFLWRAGTRMSLASIAGYPFSQPVVLNGRGQVAGCAIGRGGLYYDQTSGYLPFRWQAGTMTTLGHLDEYDTFGCAKDLNQGGLVVGDSGWHAFAWQGGKLVRLPELPGDGYGETVAVNDHGWIIGNSASEYAAEDYHAVLWKPKGPLLLG